MDNTAYPTTALNSPKVIKKQFPISLQQETFIAKTRRDIVNILNGQDPRLLLIVGPCSIHDVAAAYEYATKLNQLAKEVSNSFLIVMRTYFEKPRTTIGWKGMLYDPHLNKSNDIPAGIRQARMLLIALAEMGLPTATEFLDPVTSYFIGDLISWACIGARTAESQIHRQFASGLPMPVAFKNNTAGNIETAINSVVAATHPHTFFGIDEEGFLSIKETQGNPHAHIALRGGEKQPNYDQNSIALTLKLLKHAQLPQRVIIDCSHDNSLRQHEKQIDVFQSVVNQYLEGTKEIRGVAFESHLFSGNQNLNDNHTCLQYAVSLTDPCLDWNSTEKLIRWGDSVLKAQKKQKHYA